MKKYFITLGIIVTSIVLTSCDDELTKKPYDALSSDVVFSSPDGFSNALRGVYAGFIDNSTDNIGAYYGGDMFSVPDILTDNVVLNQNGRQSKKTLYDWLYNANGYGGFDLYGDAYKIIRKSNAIINNIDILSTGDFKNNTLGEALTARALAHFDLVRTYAQIPTQSSGAGASLGVAYVTIVDPTQKPARNTVDEVYSNIIIDLTTAQELIDSSNDASRFNKNAVNGLLSRVYLYMGQWQNAIAEANKVTSSVASISNFPKLWKDESSDGIISQFLIRIADDIAIGTEYSQTSPASGVRSEYNVDFDFFQMYTATDVRKNSYFSTSSFGGISYNHIAKYFGKTGQNNNIVNAKIIRTAEVMLNKAEAYTELSPPNDAGALVALNAVRSQRYTGFVSGGETGQALKDAIALERRLELAFEGHRLFDIKRKGLDVNRSTINGDVSDGTGVPSAFTTLAAGDHKFQLPIPQSAINANTNLIQNPGY